MSRAVCLLICWFALTYGAFAQTANDPNEGFRVSKDSPTQYTPSWYGHAGRTYFLQSSFDLATWVYVPGFIVLGQDEATALSFDVTDQQGAPVPGPVFFRLKYYDFPTTDPYSADFDGDKVPNDVELDIGTDPLHFADSDMDGMPDDWETWFGLNPGSPTDATGNLDGDTLTNLAEYQNGAAGTDPTDYYNGVYPGISLISGNYQTAEPSHFSPQPLVFEAKFAGTNTPVNHGPITIVAAGNDGGQVSLTNDGSGLAPSLNLFTGTNGRVQVYYKHPAVSPYVPATRQIYAQVGSTTTGAGISSTAYAFSHADYSYPILSAGHNAARNIDDRIYGETAAVALPVFSVQNHSILTPNYMRNTSSWCYDLRQQMTCISPWNSDNGVGKAGTAITAQHIITAKHVHLAVGASVRFITANNVIVSKFIRGLAETPNSDIAVLTLDSPLPASITPCKILPDNYPSYLSYLDQGRPPVMMLDKEEKALVGELRSIGSGVLLVIPAIHTKRLEFYEDIITGDSGNPVFLILNETPFETLVLLTTFLSGYGFTESAGGGPFSTAAILNSLIVAADADVVNHPGGTPTSTGLQVQTVDLSGFSTFTPP